MGFTICKNVISNVIILWARFKSLNTTTYTVWWDETLSTFLPSGPTVQAPPSGHPIYVASMRHSANTIRLAALMTSCFLCDPFSTKMNLVLVLGWYYSRFITGSTCEPSNNFFVFPQAGEPQQSHVIMSLHMSPLSQQRSHHPQAQWQQKPLWTFCFSFLSLLLPTAVILRCIVSNTGLVLQASPSFCWTSNENQTTRRQFVASTDQCCFILSIAVLCLLFKTVWVRPIFLK